MSDNGELFITDGIPDALQRHTSPDEWARLTPEWKAAMLELCRAVLEKKLKREEAQNA